MRSQMKFLHWFLGVTPPTPLMPSVIRRRRLIAAAFNAGWQFGWAIMMVAVLRFVYQPHIAVHGADRVGILTADLGATGAVLFVVEVTIALVAMKFGFVLGQRLHRACAVSRTAAVVGMALAVAVKYLLPRTASFLRGGAYLHDRRTVCLRGRSRVESAHGKDILNSP